MSAGICIMNRNAIAMAADSAVTVGDHIAIHNSANKLFSLSRIAPVGLIIYANSDLMNVPMEIIVKEFKKELGDKTYSLLKDYVGRFITFIENNSELLRFNINEKNYIDEVFFNLIRGLELGHSSMLEENKKALNRNLSDEEIAVIASEACQQTIDFIEGQKKIPGFNFEEYIKENYEKHFIELFEQTEEFKWMNEEQRKTIAEASVKIFDTEFERNGYLGLAIAGYGEDEIFPGLYHLHISGYINGKLRYWTVQESNITETQPASITPLAQTDVMDTFLFGINDRFLNDLANEIPKQIEESIVKINDECFAPGKKDDVKKQLNSVTGSIIQHMLETAGDNYMRPIMQSVSTLPIEELALLAESMINITSIRRKVAFDKNIGTVGGPIDVAIVSKGDGFIWLKRKHYFDRQYNPQYIYSHFGKTERSVSIDE